MLLLILAESDESTLINDLLRSYNKLARPERDVINITIGLSVQQIIDVVMINLKLIV